MNDESHPWQSSMTVIHESHPWQSMIVHDSQIVTVSHFQLVCMYNPITKTIFIHDSSFFLISKWFSLMSEDYFRFMISLTFVWYMSSKSSLDLRFVQRCNMNNIIHDIRIRISIFGKIYTVSPVTFSKTWWYWRVDELRMVVGKHYLLWCSFKQWGHFLDWNVDLHSTPQYHQLQEIKEQQRGSQYISGTT